MTQEIIKKCFLCEEESTGINIRINNLVYEVDCENCGKYKITDYLLKAKIPNKQKEAAIWYIKDHADELISAENIEHIEQEYKKYIQDDHC